MCERDGCAGGLLATWWGGGRRHLSWPGRWLSAGPEGRGRWAPARERSTGFTPRTHLTPAGAEGAWLSPTLSQSPQLAEAERDSVEAWGLGRRRDFFVQWRPRGIRGGCGHGEVGGAGGAGGGRWCYPVLGVQSQLCRPGRPLRPCSASTSICEVG